MAEVESQEQQAIRCVRLAAVNLRLAAQTPDPDARKAYLSLAEYWSGLAKAAEAGSKLH